MPRVPVAEGFQVREQQFQPTQQVAPDVGAPARQLGQALGQASDSFDRIAARQDTEAAYTAQQQAQAGWLQTDLELRKEFRGGKVDGYQEKVKAYWDEAKTKFGANLSPRAQALIGKSLGQSRLQAENSALRYYETEKERATVEAWSAAKATTIQMAITDGSPQAIEAARQDIRQKNAIEAARTGRGTEEMQVQNLRDLTSLHLEFINGAAPADAEKAKAYFDKYKDEIDATRHDTVKKVLKGEGDNQSALKFAAENAALPLADQLTKAAEIADPELRKKTIEQLKLNQSLKVEAQREREKQYSDQAWQMVGQGKRPTEIVLQNMDGKERVQLQEFLRQRAERGAGPVKTDGTTHAELWEKLTRDPQSFKDVRLQAYANKLSQADLEQLYRAQQGLLNPKNERDIITFNNKVTGRLEMLGVNSGASDQKKRGDFRIAAQREYEAFEARTGKKPGPEDEEKILDRLMLPGRTPFFSGNAGTYAESVARGKPFVPKVPDADKALITEALKARGRPVTDQAVLDVYKQSKGIQ